MKKIRIKAYWLLLLVLLYTAGGVLSVGEAQARYVTTATWNTVVQHEETGVTSDCLEDVSGAPLTILLGIMPQEPYPVSFQLTAGEAVSGNLAWTVDLPEYIDLEMRIGDTVLTPETTIEMAAGETVAVVMTLIPSETAFTEVREAVDVSVAVTWADTLKGTFLTQLPAVEEEEEPTEPTEPPTGETEPPTGETEPPTGETEPPTGETEPPTGETEPPTEETEPPTEETEPPAQETEPPTQETEPDPTGATEPDPTDPGTGTSGFQIPESFRKLSGKPGTRLTPNNETSDDETVPEDTTEPVIETEPEPSEAPEGQSEEPTDPSEPKIPEEETGDSEDESESSDETTPDPTEPTEPVQEEPTEMTILLETVSTVNSAGAVPIQITASENGGPIHLGIASVVESVDPEGESQTVLDNFPQYTRFSLTDGESYFMLYHADTIALNLEDGETISVLLDLSHVDLEQIQVVLGATPQGEEASISTCTTTVIPESAQYTSLSSRILSVGMPLEIAVSEYWKDYNLEYTVEMLTTVKSEDGETETMEYVTVELPEDSLQAEFVSDETDTKLIFSIGETLPPAGTYRVSLNWTFEEVCYAQTQEIFFINYSVYTESEETGGAEQ